MDTVGIKIEDKNVSTNCLMIIRKATGKPFVDIKARIASNDYVLVADYLEEEDILKVIQLYGELIAIQVACSLYEHDELTTIEFLQNLVDSYREINNMKHYD